MRVRRESERMRKLESEKREREWETDSDRMIESVCV